MGGPLVLDSNGAPMRPASSPVRTMRDASISAAFAGLGGQTAFGGGYNASPLAGMFGLQLAFTAYLTSGLLQKTIDIPAADRTREWRDWQADDKVIQKIEAEEKRLQIRAKFKAAEVLRGLGGGALVLALPGEPASPAPATAKLQAVNVVSRQQLTLVDVNDELTSPLYGEPAYFRMETSGGGKNIHPSRVIAFRGEPYPAMMSTVSVDDRYWGQSRLLRVVSEVAKSDNAARWFSELIRKAKLLRFGVSGLTDYDQDDLNRRVALIAQGENILSASIYNLPSKDGAGNESGGEKIEDYQVSWAGIPAVQDMLDQRVAAVADIPFTRLMGRSPAGMNSTGTHDMDNYIAAISAGQELEVRPCLERLDAFLLASAGVEQKDDQTWKWTSISKPNPTDEATRFKTTMDALAIVEDKQMMPSAAFAAGAQGVIESNGWMPGAQQILGKMSPDERFGIEAEADGSNPSEFTQQQRGEVIQPVSAGEPSGEDGSQTARRRAANDKVLDADS